MVGLASVGGTELTRHLASLIVIPWHECRQLMRRRPDRAFRSVIRNKDVAIIIISIHWYMSITVTWRKVRPVVSSLLLSLWYNLLIVHREQAYAPSLCSYFVSPIAVPHFFVAAGC